MNEVEVRGPCPRLLDVVNLKFAVRRNPARLDGRDVDTSDLSRRKFVSEIARFWVSEQNVSRSEFRNSHSPDTSSSSEIEDFLWGILETRDYSSDQSELAYLRAVANRRQEQFVIEENDLPIVTCRRHINVSCDDLTTFICTKEAVGRQLHAYAMSSASFCFSSLGPQ